MNEDHDYDAWVRNRRALVPPDDLTGRILSAIESQAATGPAVSQGSRRRLVPALAWTAASLLLVARLAAMVGNLIYPTGYPEFASDQKEIEEVPHEHRNVSRS